MALIAAVDTAPTKDDTPIGSIVCSADAGALFSDDDGSPRGAPMTSLLPPLRVSDRAQIDLGFVEVQDVLRGLTRTPFGKEALVDDVFPVDRDVLEGRSAPPDATGASSPG